MITAFAPGRVTLIGEHTDYNEGLALPFAITRGVTVTCEPQAGNRIDVVTETLGETDSFALDSVAPVAGWRAHVRGVVAELCAAGHRVAGARLRIRATLEQRQGLASSAALEVALCLALLAGSGEAEPDRLELARLCARVENAWVGANTGLLDQLASLFGAEDHALCIDFRSLDMQHVALRLEGWTLALLHSGEQRELAATAYNERRSECARVLALLDRDSMRAVTRDDVAQLPEPLSRRARHVLDENARVSAMVRCLQAGDLTRAAQLLSESHRSLRDLYDVSTPAVEATVAALLRAGAEGARLVGGGFGGQVLALFPPGVAPPPAAVAVSPAQGARLWG